MNLHVRVYGVRGGLNQHFRSDLLLLLDDIVLLAGFALLIKLRTSSTCSGVLHIASSNSVFGSCVLQNLVVSGSGYIVSVGSCVSHTIEGWCM